MTSCSRLWPFYDELNNRVSAQDWVELCSMLDTAEAPDGFNAQLWGEVRSAHLGFQAGADIVAILPSVAEATGFYNLTVNPDLTSFISRANISPPRVCRRAWQKCWCPRRWPSPMRSS